MPTSTRGKGKWKSYSLVVFERVVWAVEVIEGWSRTFTVCSSWNIVRVQLKICECDLCTKSFLNSFQKLNLELCSKRNEGLKFVKSDAIH